MWHLLLTEKLKSASSILSNKRMFFIKSVPNLITNFEYCTARFCIVFGLATFRRSQVHNFTFKCSSFKSLCSCDKVSVLDAPNLRVGIDMVGVPWRASRVPDMLHTKLEMLIYFIWKCWYTSLGNVGKTHLPTLPNRNMPTFPSEALNDEQKQFNENYNIFEFSKFG